MACIISQTNKEKKSLIHNGGVPPLVNRRQHITISVSQYEQEFIIGLTEGKPVPKMFANTHYYLAENYSLPGKSTLF